MPRYEQMQRRKTQQAAHRRWELPSGSHVWCYLRHSPGDNQTIDSQRAGMQEWCAEMGWIADRLFIDEAMEGSREDREQFQLMLSLSRQEPRPVDGIAVWSFSRFARNQLDAQFHKADLRKRGYVIVSKIDDIPNNEMAPIYEAFIDWKNQRFLDDLSADVRRGQNFLVERGYWPGGTPPMGYTTVAEEMGQRRNGEVRLGRRLVKDEAVAARVVLAWRMKLRDNASYLQIHEATHLYSDSKHYSTFFDNLLYTGIFSYHGKRYPANWEDGGRFCDPYVTLDEYLQVQENRRRRTLTVKHPRSLSSSYLLTGLVACGHCSQNGKTTALVGQTDNRREDTRYYRCSTKIRAHGRNCPTPRIQCWRLDEAVIGLLKETVLTSDYIMAEIEQANVLLAETDTDVKTRLDDALRQVKVYQKKVEAIVELMGKKGVTPILEAQYDTANRQWLEATAHVSALKAQIARQEVDRLSLADTQRCLDEMLSALSSGSLAERQALVSRFVERVMVHADHAEVKLKFRLDALTSSLDGWFASAAVADTTEEDSTFRSPRQVYGRCPQGDSNARTRLRRPVLYPLSYGGQRATGHSPPAHA